MADMTNTQAEHEVEQQMYQAMAAQMQSEGMDVTAEEIAQTVEEQTSDHPPEPSEKDAEIMEQMAAYQAEHFQPAEAYVVRGALLHCQYGSHCRRLNLPRCHGVYTLQKPIVFKRDCKKPYSQIGKEVVKCGYEKRKETQGVPERLDG